jgi:uncharacterized protein (TIGR03067 family)
MSPRWSLVVVGALIAASAARGEDKKPDADEIQDTWRIVAVESNGKKEEMRGKDDGSFRAVISAEMIEIRAVAGFFGAGMEMTYKIVAEKKPKALDVKFTKVIGVDDKDLKRRVCQGIYSLRGDKLKICIDLGGKARPSAFDTKADDGLLLYYLERE